MRNLIVLALTGALTASVACAQPARRQTAERPIPANPALNADIPKLQQAGASVLFWSQEQRNRDFARMEQIFPGHVVKARGPVRAIPRRARPLNIEPAAVDDFMTRWNTAAIVVVKQGRIVLERYGLGFSARGRWTSFSVAKSFTSTLVGAALQDGAIKSLDDPVTRYIPDLAGSGYDGVTVRQLLTMTSGVKWNEDYTDPNSDVARMLSVKVRPGEDPTVAYMRTLPRESAPGTAWVYKTGETNLIGVLVHRATGRPLANYLSEKVFGPAGMERDGFWMTDQSGQEISGCCISVTARDYARIGLFALEGGKGVVPAGWFADATKPHAPTGRPGFGYGYQWWTYPNGLYGAQGIFGQSITVDPASKTVIVILSSWPKATAREQSLARMAFVQQLLAAD